MVEPISFISTYPSCIDLWFTHQSASHIIIEKIPPCVTMAKPKVTKVIKLPKQVHNDLHMTCALRAYIYLVTGMHQ